MCAAYPLAWSGRSTPSRTIHSNGRRRLRHVQRKESHSGPSNRLQYPPLVLSRSNALRSSSHFSSPVGHCEYLDWANHRRRGLALDGVVFEAPASVRVLGERFGSTRLNPSVDLHYGPHGVYTPEYKNGSRKDGKKDWLSGVASDRCRTNTHVVDNA